MGTTTVGAGFDVDDDPWFKIYTPIFFVLGYNCRKVFRLTQPSLPSFGLGCPAGVSNYVMFQIVAIISIREKVRTVLRFWVISNNNQTIKFDNSAFATLSPQSHGP